MSNNDNGYNGWANYETWNVALWLNNDEGLYTSAHEIRRSPYTPSGTEFMLRAIFEPLNGKTPDGVSVNDPKIDMNAIGELLTEIAGYGYEEEPEELEEPYDDSCAFRIDSPIG